MCCQSCLSTKYIIYAKKGGNVKREYSNNRQQQFENYLHFSYQYYIIKPSFILHQEGKSMSKSYKTESCKKHTNLCRNLILSTHFYSVLQPKKFRMQNLLQNLLLKEPPTKKWTKSLLSRKKNWPVSTSATTESVWIYTWKSTKINVWPKSTTLSQTNTIRLNSQCVASTASPLPMSSC